MILGVIVVLSLALTGGLLLLRQDAATGGAGVRAGESPVERGREAYFKHCVACHSPDTDEYVAAAPLKDYFDNPPTALSDGTLFPRTDEAIRELIENGTTRMPPLLHGMTPQELDDILAYMHTL